jgi:hypothetical protein
VSYFRFWRKLFRDERSSLSFRRIDIATLSADREGRLAMVDGRLVAVLVRLDDEVHGIDRGAWFLDAGFGRLAGEARVFATLEEAADWILVIAQTAA